ncbi:DNA cytosine methyltransferase [Pleurocapsa sp. FMAR1]|uniref:DNA cytosine methyltransferase n=1 Tax=Pleurocapsa sp. FMAR1 TaxID=3040204 RepID=UPI0029C884FC|nr:DNA cytosine methyltransferase [Pleurocapsa sp. FMAR1]
MKTVDVFAGCGGLSLGFQNAGFEIVAAFDNWIPAIEVYQDNFKHSILNKDLSKKEFYEIIASFNPEMIIGGPPCQDFSSAGKRNENLGRANLTRSFANIISFVRPKWFVMENVSRIKISTTLPKIIDSFKKSKYGLTSIVINASYCGVPQARKRYFLIGELNGKDNSLKDFLNKNLAKKPMSIFDYLGNDLGVECYYRHPRSYNRRAIFSIHEPSPTIRGVNRPVPKTYKKHKGDAADVNDNLRSLTTIERSYIQTFPKSFKFRGSKSNLEQMIGNAVPVKLAEYVASCLAEYMSDSHFCFHKQSPAIQLKLFEHI